MLKHTDFIKGVTMLSQAAREQNVRSLKNFLRGGHLKVLGYNIDGRGNSGIWTECKHCGKVSKRPIGYWQQYPNCYCQRAANISKSQLKRTDLESLLKAGNVKALSTFKGQNQLLTVECLRCAYTWDAWPGSLRRGHGCTLCAQERIKKNNLKKYGVENSAQRPEVIEKRRRTMLRKYGVERALQNKEIFDKNLTTAFKHKDYCLGKRVVKLQGYEPQAVDYIREVYKIKPSDIECGIGSAVPSILYTYRGKQYAYHPDIWIKSLNRIVEVKSAYTYRSSLKKNLAKKESMS